MPSRINASFIYRVKNKSGPDYTTNIANGAISHVFPPRHRQWGHGYMGNNFETNIHIRNTSHNPRRTLKMEMEQLYDLWEKIPRLYINLKLKQNRLLQYNYADIIPKR